uniref:Aminopeptidase n=1 Tax=Sinocyclocheilus anshuiensis TaxID=1608454 RepID=A0A671SQL1_9TELE
MAILNYCQHFFILSILVWSLVYFRICAMCVGCTFLGMASLPTIVGLWTVQLLPSTEAPAEPWNEYRLPDTLVPDYYNIMLWPQLQPNVHGLFVFTGNSSVVFKCLRETALILIHSNKLNLTSIDGYLAKLSALGTSVAPSIHKTLMQEMTQYLVIQLKGKLKAGEFYELYTEFVGELADVAGIVATSQMHSTHARKTFPCFDEPAMRAVFYITLIHNRGTVALSNGMEIKKVDTVLDGQPVTVTTFEPTKNMSSYLLALVVSDYTNVTSANDTLIRIWARKKAIEDGHGDYALNITGPILKFFEKYYSVPYPLSKSDQIALPDFYFGAMENWGLVTYKETNLLYQGFISSNANKERTATIIAHELAHMWFGNLVTLKWWNEVWLNEGFAPYVSYLGADFVEPSWNVKDLIILKDVHRVSAVDALASSHPLSSKEEDIIKPEQITEQFDTVSYSKGASVLRMLSDFLTEPVFVQGLNTVDDKSGTVLPLSVKEIMDRWVLQMGFPVVTVNTTTGHVSQMHFLLDPESSIQRPSPFNYEWIVPINWMKVNMIVFSYTNWERLLNQLTENHEVIPVINRAQIVDDAFKLQSALNLDYFYLMFTQTDVYEILQNYTRKHVTPLFYYFKIITEDWSHVPTGHTDQYLGYTLDAAMIRKQDATSVIVYIASNPDDQTLAWNFVRRTGRIQTFTDLIRGITKTFSTESELEKLLQFKSDNSETGFGSGTAALEQAIEKTKANIKWVAENQREVTEWLVAESA